MVWRRRGEECVAAKRFVVDQRCVVALEQKLACPLLKSHGPVEGFHFMTAPRVRVQVTNEVPAPDYQDAFVTQGRQTLPNFMVKFGRLDFIDARLHAFSGLPCPKKMAGIGLDIGT